MDTMPNDIQARTVLAPYGTWKSPLAGDRVYEKTSTITDLLVDKTTGRLFYVESRATEGGRLVLMQSRIPGEQSAQETESLASSEVLPTTSNVGSKVHEYGGGAAMVTNGYAYWSEFDDGQVWSRKLDAGYYEPPVAITREREDHISGTSPVVKTSIVCIDTFFKTERVLLPARKEGFYAFPRFGGVDGGKVAWIEWKHPNMPWDGSELFYADFTYQGPGEKYLLAPQKIAGESGKISINDIKWSSTNLSKLFYLSDETGFINLWSIDLAAAGSKPKLAMKAINYDLGEPLWRLAPSWYAIVTEVDALVTPNINGLRKLHHLNLSTGEITEIPNNYTDISDLRRINDKQVAFLGGKWNSPKMIVIATLGSSPGDATFRELAGSGTMPDPGLALEKAFISRGEHIVLKVAPPAGNQTASGDVDLHVTLYRPTNPCYQSPEGELPPTLVQVHGGPTARASPTFSIFHQYFTTRGFAVLDVDYGGSSGYGREYQKRLHGAWGFVDVQDTISAVEKLSALGMIDGKRVAIRGSSAGGFTALKCLTDSKVFKAGIMLYGISDIKALGVESSKFEAHYASRLIGGTLEEIPEIFEDRSPINKAHQITAKLLMFQGMKDKVVSPEQTRKLAERIRNAGGSVETIFYADEGHKIRKAENLTDSLLRTEAFLKEAFGLT